MPYNFAEFNPRIFRLASGVISGYPYFFRISSGIWNRQSASICHCGDPYQTESEPNTMRSSPKYLSAWPSRWAQTLGNVITQEAKVVPSSAYTFRNGADVCRNCVDQWMFGTPLSRAPDLRLS